MVSRAHPNVGMGCSQNFFDLSPDTSVWTFPRTTMDVGEDDITSAASAETEMGRLESAAATSFRMVQAAGAHPVFTRDPGEYPKEANRGRRHCCDA